MQADSRRLQLIHSLIQNLTLEWQLRQTVPLMYLRCCCGGGCLLHSRVVSLAQWRLKWKAWTWAWAGWWTLQSRADSLGTVAAFLHPHWKWKGMNMNDVHTFIVSIIRAIHTALFIDLWCILNLSSIMHVCTHMHTYMCTSACVKSTCWQSSLGVQLSGQSAELSCCLAGWWLLCVLSAPCCSSDDTHLHVATSTSSAHQKLVLAEESNTCDCGSSIPT